MQSVVTYPDASGAARAADGRGLTVRLLGGFRVEQGGRPLHLARGGTRLVAYLALRRRPLSRIHVAGILWTDVTEPRSCSNLRSALWRLRGRAPGLVEARGDTLELGTDVTVDTDTAAAAVTHAHANLPAAVDCWSRELLDSAELLPDWYDDWVLIERERLRQVRLCALEALSERLRLAGRAKDAVGVALAAVRADPLRDSAHRAAIRAQIADGNAAEAIRQYWVLAALLSRSLGLSPAEETRALVEGLGATRTGDDAVTGTAYGRRLWSSSTPR